MTDLKSLPFYEAVKAVGGEIWQVGGTVRDSMIGKESKDLDILITGVESWRLKQILGRFGKVNEVGDSFGIIKFKAPGEEEIDIALPRTETKSGDGHKGFEVASDPFLPIEQDLERRDFTINSIARNPEGEIKDPFGGVNDIEQKVIRLTNPKAFSDDPLRMLRAIQFASRFSFSIDPRTFSAIQERAEDISQISKERVLIEFEKIVSKGDPQLGAQLLVDSGLYKGIFEKDFTGSFDLFHKVTRLSEFCFLLISPFTDEPAKFFKENLKGDTSTEKEIAGLTMLVKHDLSDSRSRRWCLNKILKITSTLADSEFVKDFLSDEISEFKSGAIPFSISSLPVKGNDLQAIGLKGKSIGDTFDKILDAIYSDIIPNDKQAALDFAKEEMKKNSLSQNLKALSTSLEALGFSKEADHIAKLEKTSR